MPQSTEIAQYHWKYSTPVRLKMSVNANIPLHQHGFFELVYVLEGRATHFRNGEETILSEGECFVMDGTGVHGYAPCAGEPFCIINCVFTPEFLDAALRGITKFDELTNHYLLRINAKQLRIRPTETVFRDDGTMRPLFEQMFNEFAARRPGYLEMIRCHLIALLLHILRQSSTDGLPDAGHMVTRSVIAYIEKYAHGHCTLEDAAAALNYSPPYLSRRFKLDTGMTFSAYLQKTRIDNACSLLINTDLPVEAVASAIGYTDMKHFHHLFRRVKGRTPREYRTARSIK